MFRIFFKLLFLGHYASAICCENFDGVFVVIAIGSVSNCACHMRVCLSAAFLTQLLPCYRLLVDPLDFLWHSRLFSGDFFSINVDMVVVFAIVAFSVSLSCSTYPLTRRFLCASLYTSPLISQL